MQPENFPQLGTEIYPDEYDIKGQEINALIEAFNDGMLSSDELYYSRRAAALSRGLDPWFTLVQDQESASEISLDRLPEINQLLGDLVLVHGINRGHEEVYLQKAFLVPHTSVFLGDMIMKRADTVYLFDTRHQLGVAVNNAIRIVAPETPVKELGYANSRPEQTYQQAHNQTLSLINATKTGTIRDFRHSGPTS